MKKKLVLVFSLLTLLTISAPAQTFVLRGIVTDSGTGKAVTGASVFLRNTSIGTATGNDGMFTLHGVPRSRFDLVVSSLGYKTHLQNISPENARQALQITLTPKANELSEVVIGSYDRDGWGKWGDEFTGDLIGTSFFALQCTIKNRRVIKFKYSQKKQLLEAFADEPLLIENKSLGYLMHYKMESFSYSYKDRTVHFEGFPFFEEMEGSERDKKRWAGRRKEAYYGSVMQFLRCLYINKLIENGFEVRKDVRRVNVEKQRIRAMYNYSESIGQDVYEFESSLNTDTLRYYKKVMDKPDAHDLLYPDLLERDSIAKIVDSFTISVSFNYYYDIVYKKKRVPYEYLSQIQPRPSPKDFLTSQIKLINDSKPVYVTYNGLYQPQSLYLYGFWAWSEKLSSLLPYDYWP